MAGTRLGIPGTLIFTDRTLMRCVRSVAAMFRNPACKISVRSASISVPKNSRQWAIRAMFKQEGYDMMGAAFEVYNELGYGMAEEIYQGAMEVELGLRTIPFVAQAELEVHFKGHLLIPKYRPDLLVFHEIIVELKALKELSNDHDAQLFNYMRIARKQVGYLINFGRKGELEWKRYVLNDLHSRDGER